LKKDLSRRTQWNETANGVGTKKISVTFHARLALGELAQRVADQESEKPFHDLEKKGRVIKLGTNAE
jgi:ribosome-associated toxin RatA of RatAB toxin-antitoxin module